MSVKKPILSGTVNILGTNYKIITKDYDDDPLFEQEGICGYCDNVVKEIVVCSYKTYPGCENDTDERAILSNKDTLRHEIVHAFFNESGLTESALMYHGSWARNEEMVEWIALQGPKIYKAWADVNAL